MSYTGDVKPGGPADVRVLPHATIRKVAVSAMSNNVYLLTCAATGAQLLVDAADDAERCLALVREAATVWTSSSPRTSTGTTTARCGTSSPPPARTRRRAGRTRCPSDHPRRLLAQGDRIEVGALSLEVVHLRGHTPGSIALAYRSPTAAPTCSPVTRSSPAAWATPRTRARASPRSSRMSPRACSTSTTTTRGSTPATATTRRSAPSALIFGSGASAAGERGARGALALGQPASLRAGCAPLLRRGYGCR